MVQSTRSGTHQPRTAGTGRRLYDLLRSQLADGTLAAGSRLMSTRALAAELGVSRTTVTAVYEQLAAEGFLATTPGRAARVVSTPATPGPRSAGASGQAGGVPSLSAVGQRIAGMATPALPAADSARYDFLYGALACRDFPALAWRRAYQAALLRQQSRLSYLDPEGDPSLLRALQGYLRRIRGIVCDVEQILVVHGSQQAIDLCARLLLNPEDAFVFENPGYLMARRCFEATGARLLPVQVDEHGMDTDCLPQDKRVRLAYVTPSHQFPLGGVLPISRRQALLHWAQRQRAWIVEDDYDGEFRYGQRPIDALQSIDTQGCVIYIGTFSKALSPQLRLGYLVLPHALVSVFRQAKRLADRHAPALEQQVLAALIGNGTYERHVRRMRREHERRRNALLQAIERYLPGDAQVQGTAAGLHVVLRLPWLPGHDDTALATACRSRGVGIYPLSPLFAPAAGHEVARPAAFMLGYASLTTAQIQDGVRQLSQAIANHAKTA